MATVGDDRRLNYYRMTPDAVIDELRSHRQGLTNPEAARRLEQHGRNGLARLKRESPIITLLRQFKNLFVAILLVSAMFALYLHDAKTAAVLLLIAGMNTAVGFFQEHKAETLLASLEQLLVPQAKVLRSGMEKMIDSSELVLGDIVLLEAGDQVPADIRIMQEDELATNEFALTGESAPTRKFVHAIAGNVPLANRHNLVFMGTTVATGSGVGIVVGTGMHTELGRIASLAEVTQTETSPLQREMNNLAKRITQGTVILSVILTLVALRAHFGVHDALLFAIGIAAAMIPNGLVAEVNITLAQTASRMAKDRALVKKLSAVETLGATNLILTDKTGTLTKNEMTVEELIIGKTEYSVSGTGYEANGHIQSSRGKDLGSKTMQEISWLFETAVLASNARVNPPDDEHATWYVVGDPTEGALITLARKAGLDTQKIEAEHREIKEFQFDAARKLMSSVRAYDHRTIVFVKGAPEAVLARSTSVWEHGHTRKLTAADRERFLAYNETKAKQAKRNLAMAYRILPDTFNPNKPVMDDVESELIFVGIVCMVDPLREDVPAAMTAARGAFVRVSIITGDFPTTAKAIAAQAKLVPNPDDIAIVLGEELPQLADSQILDMVERGGVVFSRVAPEDKLRIVEIAKRSGKVVAVTGDGINDAPALKRADIGVAMGRTGTDVAKEAADIVLLDDSFHTLVGAIEQGRLTFQNIKKAARCALTDNAGELFAILISLVMQALFHIPIAITAIQILAIDVIAEMFPITALGWDKPLANLMHERPRRLRDHILNMSSVKEFIGFGLLSASLAYANFLFFFVRLGVSPQHFYTGSPAYMQATILTYVTIVFCQFINLLMVRTGDRDKFFTSYLWSNKKLLWAFAISLFCISNLVYNPWVQPYVHSRGLTRMDWLSALAAAGIYLCIRLMVRVERKHTRHAVRQLHHEIHGRAAGARV